MERQAEQDEYFEKLRLAEDEARREDWEKLVQDSEHFIVSFFIFLKNCVWNI